MWRGRPARNRRWAGVSHNRPAPGGGAAGTAAVAADGSGTALAASSASDAVRNTWPRSTRQPAARAWATTRIALTESPPRSKKLASRLITASAVPGRTRAQMAARSRSGAVSAPSTTAVVDAVVDAGSGRAATSSFPVAPTGSSRRTTRCAGTIARGSRSRSRRRTSAHSRSGSAVGSAGTRYPTRAVTPPGSAWGRTAQSTTRGSAVSATSTSWGSTRTPAIFTWRSTRPTNSRPPSGWWRARSPVR